MTDTEIFENEIKCITRRNECLCNGGSDCAKCDLLMDSYEIEKCYIRAIKNIDLINRQQAEIESGKLTMIPKTEEKIIKDRAIKEFADKLDTYIMWHFPIDDPFVADIRLKCSKLAKELVGE